MVSGNPNPQHDYYLQSPTIGMPFSELGPVAGSSASATASSNLLEDPSKKIRKPYTITKSRESWTEPEHDKFLEALQLFDRDWKKIEAFIGSKTTIQIRSHAQKYFLKVQKSGTSEHLPPPRPKRKASHPYPQKAPKIAPMVSQVAGSFQSPSPLFEPGSVLRPDSSSMLMNPVTTTDAAASWTNKVKTISFSPMTKGTSVAINSCSSTESTPETRSAGNTTDQGNHRHPLRVLPDFGRVYNFIGSVFDPDASGHLQKLQKMEPIDMETVLLLMRNLSINLTSPDFEDHRRLLSSYNADTAATDHSNTSDSVIEDESKIIT